MRTAVVFSGGGIRGIYSALIAKSFWPKPVDLLAGTSTGGLIAAKLAIGGTPDDILSLYVNHGAEVFDERFPGSVVAESKYSADKLITMLQQEFGQQRLSQVSTALLVPSYAIKLPVPGDPDGTGVTEGAASWMFRSWLAKTNPSYDWPLSQVCTATSAAPTYFPAAQIDGGIECIDGGVFANNPSMEAFASMCELWPDETDFRILSIGTGAQVNAINIPNGGYVQWAPQIVNPCIDGSADSAAYQGNAFTKRGFIKRFLHVDNLIVPPVDTAFDNVTPANIQALVAMGEVGAKEWADQIAAFFA